MPVPAIFTESEIIDAQLIYVMHHFGYVGYAAAMPPAVLHREMLEQFCCSSFVTVEQVRSRLRVGARQGRFVCARNALPVPGKSVPRNCLAFQFGLNKNMLHVNYHDNHKFSQYSNQFTDLYETQKKYRTALQK